MTFTQNGACAKLVFMTKIGIIGLGRLGSALARGLDRCFQKGELHGCARTRKKADALLKSLPRLVIHDAPAEIFSHCDPVFLWTRPEDAKVILEVDAALIRGRRPLLVSCVLDVPFADYTPRWAWSYPNVNLAAGRGTTLLHFAPDLPQADRALLRGVLGSVGTVYEAPPREIPFYSAVFSCGPALHAVMLETLADTLALRRGYDRDFCRRIARECAAGTVALQEQDRIDAAEVVCRVAHPGGPSEAGSNFLREKLPGLFEEMLKRMKKW